MIYIIITWVILGTHGGYYTVRAITKESDFDTSDIPQLIIAIVFPIVSHLATYMTYYYPKHKVKVLFKKRS